MKQGTIKTVVLLAVITAAISYLLTSGFDNTVIYYKTVREVLAEHSKFEKQPVRVNGILKKGSIKQKPGTDDFIFVLTKNSAQIEVLYSGILPGNMLEGGELVVQGILVKGQNRLQASEILTKCPSKYKKEALKRNGQPAGN